MDKAEVRLEILKLVHTPVKDTASILAVAKAYEVYVLDESAGPDKKPGRPPKQSDKSILD